jgi:hypothetical protein
MRALLFICCVSASLWGQTESLPSFGAQTAKEWRQGKRAEWIATYEREMYGKGPGRPAKQGYELLERSEDALGGKAIRKQVNVWFESPRGKRDSLELLLYLPKQSRGKVPVFLGMNFQGNECVNADPAIRATTRWVRAKNERGSCAARWEMEYAISRGYGMATVYYGDLDPDFDDGFANGVHALYGKPAADEWGAVAAWAWGLSRAMDYLVQDPQVDAKRVAVHGHSRIGKAALWAGASDERFAMVISNDSGEGGAAIARRRLGERTKDLNERFPHWFAGNFRKYSAKEETMPFDSHILLALIAPRPLYVASASEDLWADPDGEKAALDEAAKFYGLLVPKGAGKLVGHHIRPGKHDILRYDWERFFDFADQLWKGPAAPAAALR